MKATLLLVLFCVAAVGAGEHKLAIQALPLANVSSDKPLNSSNISDNGNSSSLCKEIVVEPMQPNDTVRGMKEVTNKIKILQNSDIVRSIISSFEHRIPNFSALEKKVEKNFSALFSGYFKDVSVKLQNNGESISKISVEIPGCISDDNCYIISLRPETPEEVQSLFIDYLEEFGDASMVSLFKHTFKGFLVCFPRDFEKRLPLDMILQIPWIAFIEHDSIIKTSTHNLKESSNTPQPSLVNIQQNAHWGLARISLPKRPLNKDCYEYTSTGKGVNIYIIDSGVDLDHPEFEGRAELVFVGPGLSAAGAVSNVGDCSGHGTEVASVAAGHINGVAKQANIKALQVLSCNGQGRNSDLIAALEWVAANFQAPGIINLSLGGPRSSSLDMAVESVISKGIPVVVAAGNGGINACEYSPAHLPLSMTVGASTQSDERAPFSNYGKCIKIFAPGHLIQVARASTNDFTISSGTSLAAPAVSGVAALILERYPTTPISRLWKLIQALATKNEMRTASLRGSPNLLLQSIPGMDVDLMSLEIDAGDMDDQHRDDDSHLYADSFGIPPLTWSWILISSLMILGIFGMFALFAGSRAVKRASFKRRQMASSTPSAPRALTVTRGRTLY